MIVVKPRHKWKDLKDAADSRYPEIYEHLCVVKAGGTKWDIDMML